MISQKFSNPLVIQPMPGIGDMVWFLPHVRAIADHFSIQKQVSVLARPSTHASTLLSKEPSIKEIIPLYRRQLNRQGLERESNHEKPYQHDGLSGLLQLAKDLRHHHFDAVWILDRHAFYVYGALLAGIPHRFGLGFGLEKIFLKFPTLPKEFHKRHARDRATEFLKSFNIDSNLYEYPLAIDDAIMGKMRSLFPKNGSWACIGIGASEKEKKWSIAHFATLVEFLCSKGIACLICGGPSEKQEAEAIKGRVPHQYQASIHCVTNLSVMETGALITESDFYIGNDTFLYNLAALQNKPSLAIQGIVPTHTYLKTMQAVGNKKDINEVLPSEVIDILTHSSLFPMC
jgi:heptosyltransferase-2